MSTYTPPYQLTDAILRLSTEIAATVKEINGTRQSVCSTAAASRQPYPFCSFFAGD